jgi:hypothetical protein
MVYYSIKYVAAIFACIFSAKCLHSLFYSAMDEGNPETLTQKEEDESITQEEQPSSPMKFIVGDTGFYFTESGDFLDMSGSKFQFAVTDDHAENQARYEKIGDAVTEYIYTAMEVTYGLKRVHIPIGMESAQPSSFVLCLSSLKLREIKNSS